MRYLIIPCALLSVFFHYDRPHLLEDGEKWEIVTGHYVFTLGLYRMFYVFNWVYRYAAEGRWNWVDTTSGVIQTLLFADFFYTYTKGMMQLGKEALPGAN
eukprot:gene50786-44401_t